MGNSTLTVIPCRNTGHATNAMLRLSSGILWTALAKVKNNVKFKNIRTENSNSFSMQQNEGNDEPFRKEKR